MVAAAAVSTNLPRFLTSFIGREADVRSLRSLLASERMVTITGTGGAGKTRLAIEVARRASETWPDGVWLIELAAASDVVGWIATTLELPGRGPALKVVASWLAAKRSLLVLDNCEHLVAASAAACQALLEQCPDLAILATSREPIGVPGEARWPVTSLSDRDALQLFESRARLVRPDYSPGPYVAVVTEICHRLDSLPLAIEMAAARLNMMSELELKANLDDRLQLLASGSRTVPARQQTMAAAIDWSHRLLTSDEATMFRRLAVFQGGFTLEAVRAVCSDGDVDVLGVLTGLVHKSMVVTDVVEATTRYRLLESQHAFAGAKLRESGEIDAVRLLHYRYFSTQPWSARDSANFWTALDWARDALDDGGIELALAVGDAGHSDQARALGLLLELVKRPAVDGHSRARALNLAARLTSRQGGYVASRSLADASVAAARELHDPLLLAYMLSGAGVVYQADDRLDVASAMYDEALDLLKGTGNRGLTIETQNQAAVLATERGEIEKARAMLVECVAFAREAHDDGLAARYLESLANVELARGQVDEAAKQWREALAIFRDLKDPFGSLWCLGGLALAAGAAADHERALRLAAAVDRFSRQWSLSAWPARVKQLEEIRNRGRIQLGERKADGAWRSGQSMNDAAAIEYALSNLAAEDDAAAGGPLSRREREVAAMVASGMTNKQIAERLFIAERTAEGHVERIRNKLGVRSRTEVATWAVAHGLSGRVLDNP